MRARCIAERKLLTWIRAFPMITVLAVGGTFGFFPISQGKGLGTARSHSLTLVSIDLFPKEATLRGANAAQRFVVLGRFADGLERDVTSSCRFHLTDENIATIETSRIVGLSQGETRLRVEVEGHEAEALIQVEDLTEERTASFTRDLGAIFTKHGCNSSGCHGGVKGANGFKLSLNSLYPEDDYKWIVEGGTFHVLTDESDEPKVPRIDLEMPENSLLLLKPTMAVVHGGGLKFTEDSPDYRTISDWIQAGAPYGEEAEQEVIRTERVEVFPRGFVLEPGGSQQLVVMAHLSNGWSEDISDQVLYASNNPEVVSVESDGRVTAVAKGETSIMIRAAGLAVTARAGVITDVIPNYPEIPKANFIDEYVFAKLRRYNIVPSKLSSDAEFLRRACLDLAGTLPPRGRVREFLSSRDPLKREKLVETLMSSPEFVEHQTFRLSQLLRVARGQNGSSSEFNTAYHEWIRDSIARNKPYDQLARERIAGQGWDGPSRHMMRFATENDPTGPQNVMSEQIRVFMGRRLDCAQCHNHPFDSWSQDQFWGLTAFFGKLVQVGWSDQSDMVIFDNPEGRDYAWGQPPENAKVIHPRTKKEVEPTFPDGTRLPQEQDSDPRQALAEWMTSHPHFAEATVNRIWSDFFGRGLVDPVDDFRSTNPPSHPDLLAALAEDLQTHGYDLRRLIGTIVRSRTYQLSSVSNQTNQHDTINYSHFRPKALEPEIYLDAISQVSGVTDEVYIDTTEGHVPVGTRAMVLKDWDMQHSPFMEIHGRYNRAKQKNKPEPTLLQALHAFAGRSFNEKLSQEGGRIDDLLKRNASNQEIIEEVYLSALSRFPTQEESSKLEAVLSESPSRRTTLEDIVWALISSREFAYNH